jgi:hypothetical protein
MKITPTAILVMAGMGVWLLGSVAAQIFHLFPQRQAEGKSPWWRRWDFFGLLPRWTFFSMVPESDFRILYRDKITGGPLTPWRVIALPRRRISRIVWNPGRRQRKAVEDLCVGFVTRFARRLNESEQSSPWSYWYLALVYYVAQVPAWPLGDARQFMISKTLGMQDKPPEILFISPFFQVSRAALAEVTDVVVEQGSHGTDVTACAHPCHS